MCRLTHLRLIYNPYGAVGDYRAPWFTSLLEACSFELQVLAWEISPISGNFHELFQRGLATQTGITVLRLDCYLPDIKYTHLSTFLPALRTISAPWNIIRVILECGRVIPNVEIRSLSGARQPLTTALRNALRGVTKLWCDTVFQRLDFKIADLSSVVLLQVANICEEVRCSS